MHQVSFIVTWTDTCYKVINFTLMLNIKIIISPFDAWPSYTFSSIPYSTFIPNYDSHIASWTVEFYSQKSHFYYSTLHSMGGEACVSVHRSCLTHPTLLDSVQSITVTMRFWCAPDRNMAWHADHNHPSCSSTLFAFTFSAYDSDIPLEPRTVDNGMMLLMTEVKRKYVNCDQK